MSSIAKELLRLRHDFDRKVLEKFAEDRTRTNAEIAGLFDCSYYEIRGSLRRSGVKRQWVVRKRR